MAAIKKRNITFRVPQDLHTQLVKSAKKHKISLNAEIVAQLLDFQAIAERYVDLIKIADMAAENAATKVHWQFVEWFRVYEEVKAAGGIKPRLKTTS